MIKIIMHGCNGKMGQVITKIAEADSKVEIVAGVDQFQGVQNPYPVFSSMEACDAEADVVIDFSNAAAVDGLLDYCVNRRLPVVLCTTGLSEAQLEKVEKAAEQTAVLKSANMSMGINLLMKLLKDAAKVLAPAGYDIELVERHHNQKVDAPSGTAILLADAVNENMDEKLSYTYDRSGRHEPRRADEIGLSAVRGGTIVGDHDVIFAGEDEVITFSHRAYSRKIFANGAISAAKFLQGKTAGLYDMSDVI